MAWIWHMCFANMKQRGVRTFLTILGVVIGVISIVSLLAIGIGVKKELLSTVESTGSVTEITAYGITEGKRKDKMLTNRRVAEIAEIEHVEMVYPRLEISTVMQYERFTGYGQIIGVSEEYLKQIKVKEGTIPSSDSRKPELLIGNYAMDMFFNMNTGLGYTEAYDKDEDKNNLTGETMQVQFGLEEDALEHRLKVSGMTDTMSYDIYCNIEVLKKYLKQNSEEGLIAGQPVDANGNNYQEWIYDSVMVKVDDTEHVDQIVKKLQDMGFQTENNKELLDSMQREVKIVQILLGGIGMIALIVAVIGIGNTMTTSVYDRLKEIGILKVLGCDPEELLFLFLLESGILGGLGGLVGILLSYGITEIGINRIAIRLLNMPKGTELAIIPPWLAVGAFFFAVLLGILAGFFPARWATKLTPMQTMR